MADPKAPLPQDWQLRVATQFIQLVRRIAGARRGKPSCARWAHGETPHGRCHTKRQLAGAEALEELRVVGIHKRVVQTVGISMDLRWTETAKSLQAHGPRPGKCCSKLSVFPREPSALKKETALLKGSSASQLAGPVMPVWTVYKEEKPRVIAKENCRALASLHETCTGAQLFGIRAKRDKGAAGQDVEKKK